MEINTRLEDAFVFSSGKNMAVFKGVGYPEEIAEYFCLEQYRGLSVDGSRPIPDQHARLVGWSSSLQHSGLDGGSQRRDFFLRHKPALSGAVRLSLHHADRYRGNSLCR